MLKGLRFARDANIFVTREPPTRIVLPVQVQLRRMVDFMYGKIKLSLHTDAIEDPRSIQLMPYNGSLQERICISLQWRGRPWEERMLGLATKLHW